MLDTLLTEQIYLPLTDRLTSGNPGQIVQIMANCEHFAQACQGIELELSSRRTSESIPGTVRLESTHKFKAGQKQAERRIFELIRSKIDDLTGTAEYDW